MSEVILQSAGIVTSVREGVATGVAEHVGVNLEGQACPLPGALNEPIKRIPCERTVSLRDKDKRRFRCLTLQLAQGAELVTADRVRGRLADLGPADVQRSGREIYLGPFQLAKLLSTVIAEPLTEAREEEMRKEARYDEDALMTAISNHPNCSQAELARHLGWINKKGELLKAKVHRIAKELKKQKLIDETRAGLTLTTKGKKAVKKKSK